MIDLIRYPWLLKSVLNLIIFFIAFLIPFISASFSVKAQTPTDVRPEGVIAEIGNSIKGFAFDADVVPQLPVVNFSFEEGTGGWTRSADISAADFQAFSCGQYPPCAWGDKYLKLTVSNDLQAPFNPYIVSDWIDLGKPVTDITLKLYFYAKSHSNDRQLYLSLQRYPKGGTDWTNTYVSLGPFAVTASKWSLFSATATFNALTGYSETKVRIVLRPLRAPVTGDPSPTPSEISPYAAQPVYFDHFLLTESPFPAGSFNTKIDVYDVGTDQQLTEGDTFLGQTGTSLEGSGAFDFSLPSSVRDGQLHNIQLWALNKNSEGVQIGTVNGVFLNNNITLGNYIAYDSDNFPTLTPTPTGGAPSRTPTPTGGEAACRRSRGDANCDGRINLADYQIWLSQFDRLILPNTVSNNANFICREDGPLTRFVDLTDFEAWRRNTDSGLSGQISPTVRPSNTPSPSSRPVTTTPNVTRTPTPIPPSRTATPRPATNTPVPPTQPPAACTVNCQNVVINIASCTPGTKEGCGEDSGTDWCANCGSGTGCFTPVAGKNDCGCTGGNSRKFCDN